MATFPATAQTGAQIGFYQPRRGLQGTLHVPDGMPSGVGTKGGAARALCSESQVEKIAQKNPRVWGSVIIAPRRS